MFADFLSSFVLGLLTPLGAVCVLPLFPGFLAYLANKISPDADEAKNKKQVIYLGLLVSLGVIIFIFFLGLLFTTILEVSLTNVISIVSPIAFGILVVISLLLIFNVDFTKYLPKFNAPLVSNPYLGAFVYGLLFGAIVIPCNPAFIAIMFTKTLAVSVGQFISNLFNFLFFGIGMASPLLIFAIISAASGKKVINFLTKYQKLINIVAGVIMLIIALYYLIFVFKIFG